MCDCYIHECAEPGCTKKVYVHIGDFCTPRDTLELRCELHPPTEGRWVRFYDIEYPPGHAHLSLSCYMRLTVEEPVIVKHERRIVSGFEDLGPIGSEYTATYYVGASGDIYPNCFDCKEHVHYAPAPQPSCCELRQTTGESESEPE